MFEFERVGDEESAALKALAQRVRDELAAAGLPVVAPGLDPILAVGADVEVDDGADAAGGVFVDWRASPRLRDCANRAYRLKLLDEPVLRHSRAVGDAMARAMADVLTSAGFSVEDARDEYRPQQLRVVAGPPAGRRVVWSVRDYELTLPGWQDESAG
ncbi:MULTISPECIES: hypothetical protein [unclassified Streptomyces]|uniref:hypothetical protein n=1 Tax=unclassified Streptomyces TaxID=2593676 RepID=UPI0004BD8B47|nr:MULTISPECIES: hypothetical protein [unclassified Streptomyces]